MVMSCTFFYQKIRWSGIRKFLVSENEITAAENKLSIEIKNAIQQRD
jgi:hypothetical protein